MLNPRTHGPWPKGNDLRRIKNGADLKSFRKGVNITLTTEGSVRARDGLKPVGTLNSNSVGLYSLNGTLRSVIPAGHSLPLSSTGEKTIYYDSVGDGSIYALGSISRVEAVTSWDVDSAIGAYPYLLLRRSTGKYEHHWLTDTPVPGSATPPPVAWIPSNDPVDTKVTSLQLGFDPGPAITKTAEKIWAIDNVNGAVRFCSTSEGPRNWTKISDAGYLSALRNALSDRLIRGLGLYDRYLAVIFSDSVQFWSVDPDPALHRLDRIMGGVGTAYSGSVVNVRGDLFYFSAGAFSSIYQSEQNGQLKEGNIGAPIAPATKLFTSAPVALWSQSRSQYMCAFGTTVFVYTVSKQSKVEGWQRWEFSVPVEYLVEFENDIYIRSGNTVYKLDPNYADGSTFTFETHYDDAGARGKRKTFALVDVVQEGRAQLDFLPDVNDDTQVEEGPIIEGSTTTSNDIYVGINTEAMATRFTGTVGGATPWKLDSLTLHVGP